MKVIPGHTNSDGIFTAKNPFIKLGTGNPQDYLHAEFANTHPPLPCYDEHNNLVKDADVKVTGPVWRFKDIDNIWKLTETQPIDRRYTTTPKQQVYLTVQPTENTLTDAKPFEAVGKEVKSAEEIQKAANTFGSEYYKNEKPANTYTFHEGFKAGANWMKDYAQLATDAGGGVDEAAEANYPTGYKDMFEGMNIGKIQREAFIKGANWKAIQSLSTHSSSEMVGKDAVILTISNWYHKLNGIMSNHDAEQLINQIRAINNR